MGYRHFEIKDENFSEISKRIKRLREVHNEAQSELAEAINIATSTMANIEQGKSAPSLEITKKIALHYEVSTDFICGLSEDMAVPSTTLDTLCRYISLDTEPLSISQSHKIPVISIRKCFFDYLNVLVMAEQLKKKNVPDEVIDAWREKEAEKAKDLLRDEKADNNTVKYALLTSRYIASDEVLGLLEKAFNESSGDDTPL